MAQDTRRYDRLTEQYSQYRPRYPDQLISHLAAVIAEAPASDLVLDIGSGTGIFTRQLRAALPDEIRIIGIEPSPAMRAQAVAQTADDTGLAFGDGVAEHLPFARGAVRALAAATAAHWFDRPAFYAEARRVLVPGGIIAIVEYVRDRGSPLAAALIEFMAQYGSQKAYAPADYRRELAGAAGFHDTEAFVLRCQLASISPPLPGWRSHHRMLPASSSGSELTAPSRLCASWRRRTGSTRSMCYSATFFSASPRVAMRDHQKQLYGQVGFEATSCARHPRIPKPGKLVNNGANLSSAGRSPWQISIISKKG
jgi:ubiquinone/menaquinone biosynthesis C-methylase UbiE